MLKRTWRQGGPKIWHHFSVRLNFTKLILTDFHNYFTVRIRGVATGVYRYIPPQKIVQVDLLWGKMTPKRLLDMSIKFYTSPKKFIPPKQIRTTPLVRIRRKFVIILLLKNPPHLKCSVSLHYIVKCQCHKSNNWKQDDFCNNTF